MDDPTLRERVRALNGAPARFGRYVLYWSQMNRRTDSNHALAWAVRQANERGVPVLFYEGLTCTYPSANDRHHYSILEGVPETAKRLDACGIGYCFYLRRRRSDPNDVLYRLAADAALVVTDDYPVFINAAHNSSVPAKIGVAFHAVDSSCIVPMSFYEKREYAAYTIRPKIRRVLAKYLHPCDSIRVKVRWSDPSPEWHTPVTVDSIPDLTAGCEIDHSVPPSISYQGGRLAAEKHLTHFLDRNLRRYAGERNEPSHHATSDMSPYLHYGQIGALEVAMGVKERGESAGVSTEAYLEELIVRRELAFNYARWVEKPDTLDNLPDWARQTLAKHDNDPRQHLYTYDQFDRASTHDPLWNACQDEMRLRGKIHGYYRMYWGKKIIEWSPSHREALATMVAIHDRWAVDGRDPNTYTNILWCFGLHDRPWQERPIFGSIRYMTYEGMKRKTDVDAYIREIGHLKATGKDPFRIP
jgi:deoxyribodipyrimidine photo-lyase